jgi:hypothetical protein
VAKAICCRIIQRERFIRLLWEDFLSGAYERIFFI